jgi:hypothetical protein
MRLSGAVLLSLLALPATAQTVRQEVYEGTIGKSAIVLEIVTRSEGGKTRRAGQYFYSKYRTPIALAAGKTALTFTEADPNCYEAECPPTATLTLSAAGKGLNGTWQAARKPTRLAVTLKPVAARNYKLADTGSLASAAWEEDDKLASGGNPFLQRLYDTDLVNGPETRIGSVGYRTVSHKGTGVAYIRLTRLPDSAMLKAVNLRLDVRRYQYQSGALECAAMRQENDQIEGFGGYEDIEIKVAYLTPALMFVQEAGSTYCGGAHPNNFWDLKGYDLKTGGKLDMNRLLKLHDAPKQTGEDPAETAQFAALKAKLKPASPWFVGGADIPDCLAEDLGYGYSLSFNAKGLVFSLTDLPHVMGACMGEYYVVPYTELKSLWRPEAKAYFPGMA